MVERSKELQLLQQVSLIVDAEMMMGNNWSPSSSFNGIEYSDSFNGGSQVTEDDKVASDQRPSSSPHTPNNLSNSSISTKIKKYDNRTSQEHKP